ncbi:MAG: sigma-70 family RNA polymerase sigma factor [Planctomycetales bacterium]|nr:sigma-70 family RNA polymerase sigma factor [Planctomycetales bacterium]
MSHATDDTSYSLIDRIREHDQAAWERLVDLYAPLVAAWCRQAGLNECDADDVMQEVFAAVLRGMSGFRRDRDGATFRGWLRVIARNCISQHFRKISRQAGGEGGTAAWQRIESIPDDLVPTDPTTEASEIQSVLQRGLQMIRAHFEPVTWQAFWQVVVDGRAAVDVASDLKISAGAVRQAKYKVLRRLRAELGEVMELPS